MLFWESSTFQTMPLSINIYLRNGSVVKNPSASVGDPGLIPGLGRSPGEGNGNPLQCSWFENPMGRGVWQAIVHGVTESDTTEQLSNLAPKKTHPVYHIPRKVRAALHI